MMMMMMMVMTMMKKTILFLCCTPESSNVKAQWATDHHFRLAAAQKKQSQKEISRGLLL